MGMNLVGLTPYGIRAYLSPTIYTSTVADSSTLTGAKYGENYALTLECLSGNIMMSPTGVTASTAIGIKIPAGSAWTLLVKKTDANPNSICSLFALSTTDVYQYAIHG